MQKSRRSRSPKKERNNSAKWQQKDEKVEVGEFGDKTPKEWRPI